MTEAKAIKCDHCGKVESVVPAHGVNPHGWIYVSGWPLGRLDFCCAGHLIAWATTPQITQKAPGMA